MDISSVNVASLVMSLIAIAIVVPILVSQLRDRDRKSKDDIFLAASPEKRRFENIPSLDPAKQTLGNGTYKYGSVCGSCNSVINVLVPKGTNGRDYVDYHAKRLKCPNCGCIGTLRSNNVNPIAPKDKIVAIIVKENDVRK